MRLHLCAPLLLPLLGGVAWAGYPDDIELSQLATWNGHDAAPNQMTSAYYAVVKELGSTIANKTMSPSETLGIHGFDVAATSTVGFIDAWNSDSGNPAPWQRVNANGTPSHTLWIPGITVRKGLPLSTEVGFNAGYIAFSNQTVFGAFGRFAPLEGYKNFPDISMQVGYAGYLGNDQLQLGVMDLSGSVGYTAPFGQLIGIHQASISPFAGVGVLRINASPTLSAAEQQALAISAVSGFSSKTSYKAGFTPVEVHLGFRLLTGDVQMLTNLTYTIGVLPSISAGVGYVY